MYIYIYISINVHYVQNCLIINCLYMYTLSIYIYTLIHTQYMLMTITYSQHEAIRSNRGSPPSNCLRWWNFVSSQASRSPVVKIVSESLGQFR